MPVAITVCFVGGQQVVDRIQNRAADVGNPERRETQLVEFGRGVGRLAGVAVTQLRTPQANSGQLHGFTHTREAGRYGRWMAFDPGAVGRAFSEHRFDDALDHLARDVKWTIVGYMVLEGSDAVRQTCRDTLASLEGTSTQFRSLRERRTGPTSSQWTP